MQVDEHEGQLATALTEYLTPAEQEQVMRGNNKPTQILESMLPVADDPKEVPGGDTEIDVYPYQLNAGAGTHRCM